MIVSADQYAALQYVGRDIFKVMDDSRLNELNHLEMIDKVNNDPKYKEYKLNEFLTKIKQSN
jgi:hypothetical protein